MRFFLPVIFLVVLTFIVLLLLLNYILNSFSDKSRREVFLWSSHHNREHASCQPVNAALPGISKGAYHPHCSFVAYE